MQDYRVDSFDFEFIRGIMVRLLRNLFVEI